MSWFDELFSNVDSTPVDAGAAIQYAAGESIAQNGFGDLSDILFGVSDVAFGGNAPDWWNNSSLVRGYQSQLSGGSLTSPTADTVDRVKSGGDTSLVDKVGGWIEKNPKTSEFLLRGLSGAVAAQGAKDAAKTTARSRVEELREADRLKQEANARMSASVTGLRKPGLIGKQMALTRINGQPVYGANGRIGG